MGGGVSWSRIWFEGTRCIINIVSINYAMEVSPLILNFFRMKYKSGTGEQQQRMTAPRPDLIQNESHQKVSSNYIVASLLIKQCIYLWKERLPCKVEKNLYREHTYTLYKIHCWNKCFFFLQHIFFRAQYYRKLNAWISIFCVLFFFGENY